MMAPTFTYIHRFEPGVDPTVRRFCFCMERAATKPISSRSAARLRRGRRSSRLAGNVLEGNMPRFFRRFREGLFDEDDVRRRAGELANFVTEARRAYGLAQPFALGYSNGANIAAAVLLLHPKTLAAQSYCAPWRRWPSRRDPTFPAFRC